MMRGLGGGNQRNREPRQQQKKFRFHKPGCGATGFSAAAKSAIVIFNFINFLVSNIAETMRGHKMDGSFWELKAVEKI